MHEKYLTYKDVMSIVGSSRTTIQRRIADGTLPSPVYFGNKPRFKESEITEALKRLQTSRTQ